LPIGETRKYRMMSDNRKQIDPYDCEIMQYTGLQDKNGVDIYEGDILRCYSKYYGIFDAKVSFMNGSFGIANYSAKQIENPKGWKHEHPCVDSRGFLLKEISDFKGGYSNISLDDDVEVIGNIYENPELL
jgi:uncharacterized phage protein (TIGR01671 family)